MAGYLWIKSKIKKLEVSILNTDNERKLLDKKVVDLKNDLQKVNLKLDSVSQKINRVANRLGI
jgi:peptidoglycan hydrolase CwlO-like protein